MHAHPRPARAAAVLLLLLLAGVAAGPARATVTVYKVHESRDGGVLLAHASNHGYYPRDLDFRLAHEADGLAMVRDRLEDSGDLRRYPVVVQLPEPHAPGEAKTTVSLERNAVAGGGEGGDEREVGRAYVIRPAKNVPVTHENLLALLLALRGLDWDEPEREVADVAALRKEAAGDARAFANLAFRRDLARSPDGRHAVSVEWKGGRLRYLFRGKDGAARELPAPDGYLATAPVWSPQGDAFAYGSLRELMVVRLDGGGANTVRLRGPNLPEFGSLDVAFSSDGDRVVFTGTDETQMPLPVYAADYWDGRPSKVAGASAGTARRWAEYARADAAAGLGRGASIAPDKRKAAQAEVDRLAALLTPAKAPAVAAATSPRPAAPVPSAPEPRTEPEPRGGIPAGRVLGALLAALAVAGGVAAVRSRRA